MERARPGDLVADHHGTPRHARLAFSARSAGDPADAWLAPVVERMVCQLLRDREDRRLDVDRADGATWIELAFAQDGDGFRIEARPRDVHGLAAAGASSSPPIPRGRTRTRCSRSSTGHDERRP